MTVRPSASGSTASRSRLSAVASSCWPGRPSTGVGLPPVTVIRASFGGSTSMAPSLSPSAERSRFTSTAGVSLPAVVGGEAQAPGDGGGRDGDRALVACGASPGRRRRGGPARRPAGPTSSSGRRRLGLHQRHGHRLAGEPTVADHLGRALRVERQAGLRADRLRRGAGEDDRRHRSSRGPGRRAPCAARRPAGRRRRSPPARRCGSRPAGSPGGPVSSLPRRRWPPRRSSSPTSAGLTSAVRPPTVTRSGVVSVPARPSSARSSRSRRCGCARPARCRARWCRAGRHRRTRTAPAPATAPRTTVVTPAASSIRTRRGRGAGLAAGGCRRGRRRLVVRPAHRGDLARWAGRRRAVVFSPYSVTATSIGTVPRGVSPPRKTPTVTNGRAERQAAPRPHSGSVSAPTGRVCVAAPVPVRSGPGGRGRVGGCRRTSGCWRTGADGSTGRPRCAGTRSGSRRAGRAGERAAAAVAGPLSRLGRRHAGAAERAGRGGAAQGRR